MAAWTEIAFALANIGSKHAAQLQLTHETKRPLAPTHPPPGRALDKIMLLGSIEQIMLKCISKQNEQRHLRAISILAAADSA